MMRTCGTKALDVRTSPSLDGRISSYELGWFRTVTRLDGSARVW
jgi:hypothetical protein